MSGPLLKIDDLSCRFGGLWANREVTFQVERGGIVGLIGPNGAGKSTLFSMVAGAQRPTAGRLTFDGRDVTGWAAHEAARAGVGRTFQLMRVFGSMTVLENLTTAAFVRRPRPRDARRYARQVADVAGLGPVVDLPAASLTAAWKKRLEMGRALATEPKLLLLDEVLSGLTPTEAREAVEIVRDVNRTGVTILMVEHVMEVIMPLCDQLVVLHYGQKISEGPPEHVANDPAVVEAYLGRAL
ncbi:amino acid/amide ABC transporter ATP-binding protein 1 (HAAT family) [Micromonospora pisi]|uniref:Amino acid/amide ABC transporter ATP-binding protein 1 (HAAT family) n=1 Tax=Micromonospora pisi TaxID=589240 RepID=A0A495JXH4_9ACTN|nr:ABC transporter ATP-binding protein [Micromonospora pisi]RKR92964.1 amino acid/amide ABC transporter ATP-binding protein 1 (HAAT family) [Micromonospora pisi]